MEHPTIDDSLHLYSYWRSSAAYRVRIGLNLKGLAYRLQAVHLLRQRFDLCLDQGCVSGR